MKHAHKYGSNGCCMICERSRPTNAIIRDLAALAVRLAKQRQQGNATIVAQAAHRLVELPKTLSRRLRANWNRRAARGRMFPRRRR
jgi:hypothetical protein